MGEVVRGKRGVKGKRGGVKTPPDEKDVGA